MHFVFNLFDGLQPCVRIRQLFRFFKLRLVLCINLIPYVFCLYSVLFSFLFNCAYKLCHSWHRFNFFVDKFYAVNNVLLCFFGYLVSFNKSRICTAVVVVNDSEWVVFIFECVSCIRNRLRIILQVLSVDKGLLHISCTVPYTKQ